MSYGPYRPVRLPDGRVVAFVMGSYHTHCCRDGLILTDAGALEHHDPKAMEEIEGTGTLDRDWYAWSGEPEPEGNAAFPELRIAVEQYKALPLDVRLALSEAVAPTYINWRWPHMRCGPWFEDDCKIPVELRTVAA